MQSARIIHPGCRLRPLRGGAELLRGVAQNRTRVLRSRLYERQQESLHRQRAEQRRTLIGSGDRSERIRTYNFPQNRVTDHRINLNLYKLDAIIAGNLADVVQALKDFDKKQRLEQAKDLDGKG